MFLNKTKSATLFALLVLALGSNVFAQTSYQNVISNVQPKIVKINGSGGMMGLAAYQSGFLISKEGHVLTAWSIVLDSDTVTATLNDGQKYSAVLLGYDPRLEIALLKIDADGVDCFNIDEAIAIAPGSRVLTFSNLFGVATGNEPASVLQGVVTAKTNLEARMGASESNYQGSVYILDAMTNNPGAAGGAVTNSRGELAAIIGKELRDSNANTWLNFAIPISELAGSIHDIRSGKMIVAADSSRKRPQEPMTANLLGFSMVPNVVEKTPPYIDLVELGSAFDRAGIQSDDLVVSIDDKMTPSITEVNKILSQTDRDAAIDVTIQRGREFIALEIKLGQ